MTGWQIAFGVLVALAGGGGAAWFLVRYQAKKLQAETTKIEVETAIAQADDGDDDLLKIIRTQAEYIVNPLQEEITRYREEVTGLRGEVDRLSQQVRNISHLYRIILGWARTVVTWAAKHPDLDPPLPPLPPEIADEL